jgi:hypothetical protein
MCLFEKEKPNTFSQGDTYDQYRRWIGARCASNSSSSIVLQKQGNFQSMKRHRAWSLGQSVPLSGGGASPAYPLACVLLRSRV